MKIIQLLIIIILLPVITTTSFAQRRTPVTRQLGIEELPKRPVDTIETADPETKVIIFSNNTWEFYRPEIADRLSDHDAYKYNWDTVSIFAFRNVEIKDIPEVVELKLFDSLTQFCCPIKGKVFSKYGPRRRSAHNGVDIPLRTGEPLLATFDGKIRYAKYNTGGYGYLVIIRHPNGLETWYAHLSRLNVNVDDYVKAGQIIGYGGNTGRSRGPHLHYEMRYKDQSFDPEFVVDFETSQIRYQNFALERRFFNIHSRASEILEEDDSDVIPGSLLAEGGDSTVVKVQKKVPQAAPQNAVYHTIKQGDTLGHIAQKYRVSVDQICRLNGISRTTMLKLNRTLRVK